MQGFVPPAYPQDRLGELRALAETSGDVLDLSVGSPCDPVPETVVRAAADALGGASGYPTSPGSVELRRAAAGWMRRRLGLEADPDAVIACVGTKEVVAGLPRLLSLRDPSRSVVLCPQIAYPTYAMGARLAGLRAVPVPLDDRWRPDLSQVSDVDAEGALVLWLNQPANPTGSVVDDDWYRQAVTWARERGIVVASDECYVEFVFEGSRATAMAAESDHVLTIHSLSKRSNMAGFRAGFIAGDPELVSYLGEVRKHAGFMVPAPVQAAATAAWADDVHVDEQIERYRSRRQHALEALAGTGVAHRGGAGTFYLWLADEAGRDAWALAKELAKAGIVCAPGDLYGEEPPRHVRVALTAPTARLDAAFSRLRSVLGDG